MNRVEVIQRVADRLRARTYLEIGIKRGSTFLEVSVPRKLGVDPDPRLARKAVVKACLRHPSNLFNSIARQTSDDFFTDPPALLADRGIDIAFVDGLHTHEQSLRDVENCLRFLNPDGVILLHDCNPESAEAARPALSPPPSTRGWSGDVWKTVVWLRSSRSDLSTFVFNCDCGIGVVSRSDADRPALEMDRETLEQLSFLELSRNRERLLDLRPPSHLQTFLDTLTTR